ncbi:photosystem II stability/assembly factor-like uncharacterized protein [Pseudomonas sp. SJZ103]|uniref:YCF48-related protein n=1 Tax=unclassified Pseudomonas TaxID=196821 RepID=UPI00119EB3E7|nr:MULTISPECIES: YCF48-related protein [unclassified Pseudomonas]MBB6291732.1 photosystem II stability/assembly factor-like uncharacterized protein [Pseudomonas sp. SJZ073]MBB6316705.1 photosystem II stability/assembly factor-like uncharacterized protein [Pseudomonas sp. JAI120]TWC59558.1 photosystem II stability/assembly factor-like uncharacterized protein [Pseudomonas sp. SJZ103]TWC76421.1 photosystem II stability/assembly factor-like uncharacterized protein [Pseudomonas sp. SJZ094]
MNTLLKALVLSFGALPCMGKAASFIDPLDQPAMISDRAVISPLYGLFASSSGVVAVGPRGHIVRSDETGQHFAQVPAPLSSDLVAVYFANRSLGWAVGHDGVILNTQDGGETWTRQLDGRQMIDLFAKHYGSVTGEGTPELQSAQEYTQALEKDGPIKPLLDVFFENEHEGWVVGAFNLILHTTDGGQHWVPWIDKAENPDQYSLHAIRRIGDHVFIVGELGLLLRLDQRRQKFVKVALPYSGSLFGLTGRKGLLVAYGLRGNVWTSRDEGASWTQLETRTSFSINAATLLADGSIVLASAGGELLFSDPKGEQIINRSVKRRTPIYGVAALGHGLYTIGPDGVTLASRQDP